VTGAYTRAPFGAVIEHPIICCSLFKRLIFS
jgi:hypothetical protein